MHADVLGAVAIALALVACSSNPSPGSSGSDGGGATIRPPDGGSGGGGAPSSPASSSSSSSGAGGSGPSCEGPGFSGATTPQAVQSVTATLVDLDGNPVADQEVQVCGINLCLYGRTGANGQVVVQGAGQMLRKPLFKWGDTVEYTRLGALLPPEAEVVYATPFVTAKLPALGTGQPFVAGQTVTSGTVSVTPPAGAVIEVDELLYDTPAKQAFRAVEIPIDAATPALDPAISLERVFGVAPLDTKVCPAAAVSVPNSAGWDAGTEVEFYVHGLEVGEEYAPYGGWAKVSDGVVSEDGTRVETAPEGGIPILGVFGIRRK